MAHPRPASTWSPRLLARLSMLSLCLLAAPRLPAHAINTSTAEAVYDAATHSVAISVRIYASDLEDVLSDKSGHEVSFTNQSEDEVTPPLLAYLKQTFIVHTHSGTDVPLQWTRYDIEDDYVWLRFRVDAPQGPGGLSLLHGMMIAEFPEEVNSVVVRDGQAKVVLIFKQGDGLKPVTLPRTTAAAQDAARDKAPTEAPAVSSTQR